MKININIDKKHAFIILFAIVISVGIFFVLAQPSSPTNPGHTIDELFGAQKQITGSCTGQVMVGVDANGQVICEAIGNDPYVPTDVQATTATHDGDFGGYAALDAWVKSELGSDYHACTMEEVIRYIAITGNSPQTGRAMASESEFTSQTYLILDCRGWTTTNGNIARSAVWVKQGSNGYFETAPALNGVLCNQLAPFLGCK